MESFVLKLDLTAFFNNIYEKVMILVDAQWETVAKAEKRIKRMFKINCDIGFKNEEGYYIPSEESVEIFKHVAFLIAFKRTNVENYDRNEENIEPIPTTDFAMKKRRRMLTDFTTSTPAESLAKKPKVLDTIVPNSTCDSVITPISKSNADLLEMKSVGEGKATNKSQTQNSTKANESTSNVGKSVNILKESSNNNAALKEKSRSHIVFNDSGEETNFETSPQLKSQKKEILLVCNLENAKNKKGRIFRVGPIAQNVLENNVEHNENGVETEPQNAKESIEMNAESDENNVSKASEAIRSNDERKTSISVLDASIESDNNTLAKPNEYTRCDNETNNGSNLTKSCFGELTESNAFKESLISCDESDILELNEISSSVDCTHESVDISTQNISAERNDYRLEKMLPKSSELTNLPNVGDFVIFKIKLVNGKISDFFVGKCEYINKRTKALKLQLTDGLSQITRVPVKFSCNADDSNLQCFNIKLQDMLEAKICQP